MNRRLLIAAGAVLGLALPVVGTTAASADSTPVNVSASVASSVTMTGLTGSIVFPQGTDGQTVNVPHAEVYSVSTNSAGGFTVTITPGSNTLAGQGSIANSAIGVSETSGAGASGNFSGASPLTVDHTTAAGSANLDETWSLNIPAGAPPGTYGPEVFTYTATAN